MADKVIPQPCWTAAAVLFSSLLGSYQHVRQAYTGNLSSILELISISIIANAMYPSRRRDEKRYPIRIVCKPMLGVSYTLYLIPGTQMTLVFVGKGLVLGGWPSKIQLSLVPGTYSCHFIVHLVSTHGRWSSCPSCQDPQVQVTLLSAFGGAAVGSTGGGVRGTWCLLVRW